MSSGFLVEPARFSLRVEEPCLERAVGGVVAEAEEPDGPGDDEADALPTTPATLRAIGIEEIEEAQYLLLPYAR